MGSGMEDTGEASMGRSEAMSDVIDTMKPIHRREDIQVPTFSTNLGAIRYVIGEATAITCNKIFLHLAVRVWDAFHGAGWMSR